MPAAGVIASFQKLKDVRWSRTDGSPVEDLDSPIYYSSASKIYMGPVSGGGGAGSFSMGLSTGGNTLGQTGVTGTRVVLVAAGAITGSQVTGAAGATITLSAPPQSVQSQNRFNLTLNGNTAGALQEVSSGTLSLAGGANITLSQNGNAITISGASVQAETQTAISGVGNSETTYSSGTVRLSELGAVTIRSTTGQQLQISVNPQSVQPETQTFLGGVAASNTTYTSGTVTLVGSGSITVLSGTGQRVIISGSQSVQPETQTFVAGIAGSDTTYSSGTVRITGVGGGVTVSSNTGQRIDISVAAPVAQTGTQFSAGVSGGNTSGNSGTVAGRVVLAGGNNITLSGSTNGASMTITVSGPNTVAQTVQTQNRFNLTLSGNTAGALQEVSSGTLTLAGGNNITLSQNGNAITISGANAAGAQTAISGIIASDATYTSGTVEVIGSGIITIRSSAGQQVVVDASQSAQTLGMFALGNTVGESSSTTRDARSLSIRGDGIVSVGYSNGSLRISATQSVQPETQTFIGGISASDTLYTSGTVRITGVGGGVTVSSNTGQRIDISVAAPVAQTDQTVGLYAINNTTGQSSSTTRDARSISIAGDGAVSVGFSAGSLRISAPTQTGTQFSAGISGGNTAGDTGTVAGRVVLAGGNGITLSGSTNGASETITISGITQSAESQSFGMSNVGNTSGTTGIASGAQVRFILAGGNNVTLSQSLNGASGTITISAASQSAESQSIGMSNIGNTSGTTGVASGAQVRMVFAGGNNITLSQSLNGASGTITISAPNAVAQTNQTLGMYAVQNTTGQSSSTTMDARTLSVAGDGIVSVGYSAGSLRISASQSVQPETQTFIGGISASDTLYTSGTVRITGVGGGITVSSNTGQRIDLSVAAPINFSAGVSTGGNTAGDTGVTGTRLVLVGSNNVTLSQVTGAAGATINIAASGGSSSDTDVTAINQVAHGFAVGDWVRLSGTSYVKAQADTQANAEVSGIVSAVADADNFTLTTGGLVTGLSGLVAGTVYYLSDVTPGAITATEPTGVGSISKPVFQARNTTSGYVFNMRGIVIPTTALTAFLAGISNVGNTSGDTGITGSRLVLAGINGITLSQSTNASGGTLSISGITQSAESQSIGMSNLGNTSGTTGIASGAQVRMLFAGVGEITLSQSLNGASGTLSISSPVQTAESQSIGMSNIGNTSGTTGIASGAQVRMLFAGGNNVTLSQSLNGASGTITISAAAQTGTQFSAGLSNIGNTAGDTVTNGGRLILAGGNGITLSGSSNGISQTITISGITQSVESQSIGASNVGNTLGTSGVASGGQVRVVIAGTSNITVSQSVNGASATLSLIGQPSFSAGVSTIGNTGGATGVSGTRLVLVGSNNVTLSQTTDANGATVSLFGQAPAGGQFSAGASNLGNTAGNTGITGTRLILVGTNNISLSQTTDANGATLSFNNTVSAFLAGASTGGNTAGDTGVTGTRLVLVGSSPVSLSQATGANGGTITINAPATSSLVGTNGISISTNGSTISISIRDALADWENMPRAQASLMTHVSAFSKTPIYWNDHINGGVLAKSLAFAISMVTASQPLSVSAHLGIYTLVNSTSAALLGSVSEAYVVSSASSVSLSGVRNIVMTGIGTHTALSSITAGEYVIGMMFSATATNAMNFSLLGASGGAGPLGGIYPGTNQLSTGTSQGIQVLAGRGSTTVNAMPANVSAADLINQGQGASMALHPWIYLRS